MTLYLYVIHKPPVFGLFVMCDLVIAAAEGGGWHPVSEEWQQPHEPGEPGKLTGDRPAPGPAPPDRARAHHLSREAQDLPERGQNPQIDS